MTAHGFILSTAFLFLIGLITLIVKVNIDYYAMRGRMDKGERQVHDREIRYEGREW